MAARARSDLLVVLLWLGLAASMVLLLQAKPPVIAEADPPMPAAEEPKTVSPDAPARVYLPPPPSPQAPAPKAVEPAPKVVEPTPKSAEPAPRIVEPLQPSPAPEPSLPATPVKPLPAAPEPVARNDPPAPKPEAPAPVVRKEPDAPSPPIPETVTVGAAEARQGRALLRLLEHGSGPEIELAWPGSPALRARLYRHLRDCMGMAVAVMDARGQLYRVDQPGAAPWVPNLDLYSGFLRRPSGRLAPEEQHLLRQARAGGRAVRLFPRRVDALLLGGLRALIGGDYGQLGTIRAHYRLAGRRVLVEGIAGDGRSYPGRIDLSPAAARSCGHGGA